MDWKILMFAYAASIAGYTALLKVAAPQTSFLTTAFVIELTAVAVILPFFLSQTTIASTSLPALILAGAALGIGRLAYSAMFSSPKVNLSIAGSGANITITLLVAAIGILLLGEQPAAGKILGIVLGSIGIYLLLT